MNMKSIRRVICATVLIGLLCAGFARQAVAGTIYVVTYGTNDVANNYNTWEGAATNILDAVAVAGAGDTVLVGDGVYAVRNQLTVTNFTLRSENGPGSTTLYRPNDSFNRMLVVSDAGAFVSGLKITNAYVNIYGAGVALELYSGTVSNCVIADCNSYALGGQQAGIVRLFGGVMTHSVISNNQSRSHVTSVTSATLQDSLLYGNRTYYDPAPLCVGGTGVVRRCRIINNYAGQGVSPYIVAMGGYWTTPGGALENCLVYGNRSVNGGVIEMVSSSRMLFCTVASNTCNPSAYAVSAAGSMTNCIIYHNSALGQVSNPTIPDYSCAPELTHGSQGNITNDPAFNGVADGDYTLAVDSPLLHYRLFQSWIHGQEEGDLVSDSRR